MAEETIFSKIIKRELPAKIVYEDEEVLAFHDIDPKAPVHILVIPKKPVIGLSKAAPEDAEILGKVLLAAAKIAKKEGLEPSGYRVVINDGKDAGQSVFHLHAHLLGGRPLDWPPG